MVTGRQIYITLFLIIDKIKLFLVWEVRQEGKNRYRPLTINQCAAIEKEKNEVLTITWLIFVFSGINGQLKRKNNVWFDFIYKVVKNIFCSLRFCLPLNL